MKIHTEILTRTMVIAMAFVAPAATAQSMECEDGQVAYPWIGAHAFHCPGGSCSFERIRRGEVEARFDFASEPWLRAIDEGGPAAGILHEGDVLVAVNGFLITSARGGRELAGLPVGASARLTVRRDERLIEAQVSPRLRCEPVMLMSGSTVVRVQGRPVPLVRTPLGTALRAENSPLSSDPLPTLAPLLRADALLFEATPLMKRRGNLGIAFGCDDCSFSTDDDDGFAWHSPQYLSVKAVTAGGAGDVAGLEPGDLITAVNGHDIKSDEGGLMFFRAFVGDVLELSFERDGEQRATTLRVQPDTWVPEPGGLTLTSVPDAKWNYRLAGNVARAWTGVGRGEVRGHETYISIAGDAWGPSALGALFSWCADCRWVIQGDETRWDITDYPVTKSVDEGGAADRAGLLPGDVLSHINGHDMKTTEAAKLFLTARGGDLLELVYLRAGREQRTVLIALDPGQE